MSEYRTGRGTRLWVITCSGHETFPFRYAWMKKGVDAAAQDNSVFARDEAMTVLGVGKNMVRSIRHWCLAAGVLEEYQPSAASRGTAVRPSALGKALFADEGWDPYLEDPATSWLLHWHIASNSRRCTTWFWAFSYVFDPEFTKEALLSALQQWVEADLPRLPQAGHRLFPANLPLQRGFIFIV